MRILVITNLYPPVALGGYEKRCADTVERLRETHDLWVLTSKLDRAQAPPRPDVLRLLPIAHWRKRDALKAPYAALRAARATRSALARLDPDLIFVWNGARLPHVAIRIAERSGKPIAYSIGEHWYSRIYRADYFTRHMLPGDRGLRRLWGLLMRLVNRHPALRIELETPVPTAICWNSDTMRRLNPVPATSVPVLERTIYPATRRNDFFASLARRPDKPPLIAFVGQVIEQKGPDVAYRALADLRGRHGIDARLELAGPCTRSMRSSLDELARTLGIAEHVRVRGPLEREELGHLLERASATVIPSVWEEPFGLVCVEAALARVPIVASRSGAIPELLSDGEHALLFEIGDAAACADALAATLRDGQATARRVEQALRHCRAFSFERYLAEMEAFVADAAEALQARAASGAGEPAPPVPAAGTFRDRR